MTPTAQPTMTFQCPHCHATLESAPRCGPDEINLCPACHQTFTLDLPDANCAGRSILLPPGVEAPPPTAPQVVPAAQPVAQAPAAVQAVAQPVAPAAAAVPVTVVPAEEAPESPGEMIRLSMARRYPGRCLGYLLAVLACVVSVVWCLNVGYVYVAAVPGVVLLYLVVHVGRWWLRMRHTTLVITDRRVIVETGVLTKESTEVTRKDVRDVLVAQDPIMRLLDVGDLVIRTQAGKQKDVVVMAVPHPDLVVQKLTPPPPAHAAPAETA
jgi:membrane protein YdbS with pleckstrin-like domain